MGGFDIKRINVTILCFIFVITILVPIMSCHDSTLNSSSQRSTLYVGGTGSGNYSSIQSAIDASSHGDTIFVYNGIYFENIFIYKSLVLKGEDKSLTIIQNLTYENTIELISEHVQIHNFSIIHTGDSSNFYAIGIHIRANNVNIENNIITAGYKGISATNREDITITGNSINNSEQALYLWNCQQNKIINNFFSNSTSYTFRLDHCNDSYLYNNKMINGDAFSLYHVYSSNSTILNNLISSNSNGIHLSGSFNIIIENNTISHNQNNAMVLLSSHHCMIKNNHIYDNDIGISIVSGSHNNTVYQNSIKDNAYYGIKIHTGYQQSTHYKTPTKTGMYFNEWTNATQAYSSDNLYATAHGVNLTQDYTSFDFDIPANTSSTYVVILGITVYIEGHGENESTNRLRCGIRSDLWEDNIWVDEENLIVLGNGTDEEISVGGDTWDTEWDADDFINGNFYVRIMTDTNPALLSVDRIRVGVNYRAYYQCLDNMIFHNAFSNNWYHGRDECSNQWNSNIIPEGNYYDNYQGTDLDNNGIGDSPYPISGGSNQDYYPLMQKRVNPPIFVWIDDNFTASTPGWQIDHFVVIQDGIDAVTDNGTVYVYNGTYYENIKINKTVNLIGEEKNNTIIDGRTLDSTVIISSNYVNISGFTVQNSTVDGIYPTGIKLENVKQNGITNNNVINNYYGIVLYFSDNITISNNNITTNNCGIRLLYAHNNSITHNLVRLSNDPGISVIYSNNNVITQNNASDNIEGISISSSLNNYISGNTANSNSYAGIRLSGDPCKNNTVIDNNASNNSFGLSITQIANNNTYVGNRAKNNNIGIVLHSANDNTIISNIISNNTDGIVLEYVCINNLIYNNYFHNIDNFDDDGSNIWNISKTSGINIIGGPFLGGNYWSNYIGQDTDNDGIGDTYLPYGEGDYLPLTASLDINQSIQDRGFPIRHAADGDWGAAQSCKPTYNMISSVSLYVRVFGTPEFDFTVELHENHPQGPLLDSKSYSPLGFPSGWSWFNVNFDDIKVDPSVEYFIVCPPAPSGVTTSFGYEWGYAFGNQYDHGSFWFTRDSGNLWRDLPTMYEFVFRTYGYG